MNFSFENYLFEITSLIRSDTLIHDLNLLAEEFKSCSRRGGRVILMGNGGSSSIASHVAVDLSKNAGIRATNFNEANLITCFANDYGHDNWMSAALETYSEKQDFLVLISSSGESKNIINAAKQAIQIGLGIATFTGMKTDNSLLLVNKQGLNFNVRSQAYNIIENVHQIWLLGIVDSCIGSSIYQAAKTINNKES